jgi:predicted nucleotide-binding protein
MAKRTAPPAPLPPPSLTLPREEAAKSLAGQIAKGQAFLQALMNTSGLRSDLEKVHADADRWHAYNIELLVRIFDNERESLSYVTETAPLMIGFISMGGPGPSFGEILKDWRDDMQRRLHALETVHDKLSLFPEPSHPPAALTARRSLAPGGRAVFVVHGHDDLARETVVRFLERLGLDAIVLFEQPSKGQTIIEKFEEHADRASFAIVLLTPDDVGGKAQETPTLTPRARQNVILELGFFMGSLGRDHTCCLVKPGVEKPSDYDGVVYVDLDDRGAWKLLVAQEMRAAGLDVDLNRAMK